MRFAAIDIGSNAVRLLLCNVYETDTEVVFKKAELVRMPLRLGEDAFGIKKISPEKEEQLVKIMKAYRLLIDAFQAVSYHACATAAMREASNSERIISKIIKQCNIDIEIIDGKTEAFIIYSNHIAEHLEHDKPYLYIDVGGGSTELTLFHKNKVISSQSFNVGTIRMLQNKVQSETWDAFKEWTKKTCSGYENITAIGSGGNINKIYKMTVKKENKILTVEKLKQIYLEMKDLSVDERIARYALNPDRADVIVPAARIFLAVAKSSGIEEIIVPQVGLSDGIIHQLYENHIRQYKMSV
jgi:exopolyphosphatase/guanosine-5'-triphosphate,3'-diphosphate pyrophosphatase